MGVSILLQPYTRPHLNRRRHASQRDVAYVLPIHGRAVFDLAGGRVDIKKKSFKNDKFDKGGFFQTRECLKMLGSG